MKVAHAHRSWFAAGVISAALSASSALAAERIVFVGDRTMRLVKAGDGLATTTFNGVKGDRVSQIRKAREAFLNATSPASSAMPRAASPKRRSEKAAAKSPSRLPPGPSAL